MMAAAALDALVYAYFASHIPATLIVDAQAILPPAWLPAWQRELLSWYCKLYADPLMCRPQAWFRAIVYVEVALQLPFFFVALWAWARRREWLRIPLIVYGAHVATTLVPIYGAMLDAWASGSLTSGQLCFLAAVYAPYLLVPLALVAYAGSRPRLFATPAVLDKKKAT